MWCIWWDLGVLYTVMVWHLKRHMSLSSWWMICVNTPPSPSTQRHTPVSECHYLTAATLWPLPWFPGEWLKSVTSDFSFVLSHHANITNLTQSTHKHTHTHMNCSLLIWGTSELISALCQHHTKRSYNCLLSFHISSTKRATVGSDQCRFVFM